MDNGHAKPQGGPLLPGPGKIRDDPPQATYQPTIGRMRVIKRTPALEVVGGLMISTLVEVNVQQLLIVVLCSVLLLFCFERVNTVVKKVYKHASLNG